MIVLNPSQLKRIKVKVHFTTQHAMKAHTGSTRLYPQYQKLVCGQHHTWTTLTAGSGLNRPQGQPAQNYFQPNTKHYPPFCSPNSRQLICHYNEVHLPCVIMPSTKTQACTISRSIMWPALQLTALTIHQNHKLEQHQVPD